MPYLEVDINLIDPNPFQTRRKYDEEVITKIATSTIKSRHGILQAPLARPHPDKKGRYQLAFGHGRVAAMKQAGINIATLRVEDLTESELKKYVLIENVNRSDLTDDETWDALEQYREDEGWTGDEYDFFTKMESSTGVDTNTIRRHYQAKPLLEMFSKLAHGRALPSVRFVSEAIPISNQYDVETAAKVLEWANRKGWNIISFNTISQSLKKFDEKVFADILKHEYAKDIIGKMAELITDFTPEQQLEILKEIRVKRYNQKDAIDLIERVLKGEQVRETTLENEYDEVLEDIRSSMIHIRTWGTPQYGILGEEGWSKACEMFTTIEEHLRKLKLKQWDKL